MIIFQEQQKKLSDTGSHEPGNALITFEAFKVWGGEIHAINAFLHTQPQATARFWSSTDPIPKR